MKQGIKRLLSVVLLLVLIGGLFPAAHAAAGDPPGYYIHGTADEAAGTFELAVYARGVRSVAGRLALGFDQEKLELADPSSLGTVMTAGSGFRLNTEHMEVSQIVSNDGYVSLFWNPSYAISDSTSTDRLIATIHFRIREGITTDQFDNETVRLMRLRVNENWRWDSMAIIMDSDLYTWAYGTTGNRSCAVTWDYPNCDVMSMRARDVTFCVTDDAGNGVTCELEINGERLAAPNGRAETKLSPGVYPCVVTAERYEKKVVEVEITDDQTVDISLRTAQQMVDAAIAAVEIGYTEGDSADAVRGNLSLPVTGLDGCSVSWKSSRPVLVSDLGTVCAPEQDVTVTLNATATYGDAQASRSFVIRVVGTGSPDYYVPKIPTSRFTDLTHYGWAEEAINALTQAGIISGTSENTFAPGSTITRGDFVALLMRMLAPESNQEGAGFEDVPESSYYSKEIKLAQVLGIASGTDDGRFLPQADISREDLFTLTYRALVTLGHLSEGAEEADLNRFKDAAAVSDYAKRALGVLVGSGYISGNTDGTLLPKNHATRAEAAVFLYQVYCSL